MITGARGIKDLIRNHAKGDGAKSQMLLRHYAMERLLERLSVSDYRDDFVIKGGMLVASLVGVDERSTRDIDATMRGHDMSLDNVSRILAEVASIDIGDGFTFELGEPQKIMEDSEYGGMRIGVSASIEKTKTAFKIDISTGDAITPDAIEYEYKLLFEDRSVALRSYNTETALAEKLETILSLATQTTRMRDFYDIYALMESGRNIDFRLLGDALDATMAVRASTASLDRSDEIIVLLEGSEMMEGHWSRYQAANSFAESVSWQDTLASLRTMVNAIKAATAAHCPKEPQEDTWAIS